MSELKDVKCKYCQSVIGQRRHNEFHRGGMKQKHSRSFAFECPECNEWQWFAVNRNDVKEWKLLQPLQTV